MKHALSTGLVAALALTAAAAGAEQPYVKDHPRVTRDHPQIGVRLGYGVYTGDDLPGDVNPYSFGAGLTVGYSFGSLYLGASGEYYAGGVAEAIDNEPTSNVFNLMFEPGWDILVNHKGYILRPQVGVGVSGMHAKACVDLEIDTPEPHCHSDTEFKPAVAPGLMFMIDDFGGFYGQVGARYHWIFVDEGNASGVLISAGVGAAW